MSKRIDYEAAAVAAMAVLGESPDASPDEVIASTAVAQVFATLAVAEQLRRANVIAYAAASRNLTGAHKEQIEREIGL